MSKKKRDFTQLIDLSEDAVKKESPQQEKTTFVSTTPHVIDSISSTRPVIRNIEIDKIIPSSSQPRKTFNEKTLKELSNSIIEKGVLQEIAVKRVGEGNFEILYGERRWRAGKIAGLKTIPSRILDERDDADELSLIENIHREDLLPEEFSKCVKNILNKKGYTQADMAVTISKSQGTISKCLSIASFVDSPGVMEEIVKMRQEGNNISFEILFLASLKGTAEQGLEFLREVLKNKITTKAARKLDRNVKADVASAIRKLKFFRSRLDFSFLDSAHKEDHEGKIKKEIDLTIVALNQILEMLINIKKQ